MVCSFFLLVFMMRDVACAEGVFGRLDGVCGSRLKHKYSFN
jgi:hypothetical protein